MTNRYIKCTGNYFDAPHAHDAVDEILNVYNIYNYLTVTVLHVIIRKKTG